MRRFVWHASPVLAAPTEPRLPSYHDTPLLDWFGLRPTSPDETSTKISLAESLVASIEACGGFYRLPGGPRAIHRLDEPTRTGIMNAHRIPVLSFPAR